jgi:hypothetical protein
MAEAYRLLTSGSDTKVLQGFRVLADLPKPVGLSKPRAAVAQGETSVPPEEVTSLLQADPSGEAVLRGWERLREAGVQGAELVIHRGVGLLLSWSGADAAVVGAGAAIVSKIIKSQLRSVCVVDEFNHF